MKNVQPLFKSLLFCKNLERKRSHVRTTTGAEQQQQQQQQQQQEQQQQQQQQQQKKTSIAPNLLDNTIESLIFRSLARSHARTKRNDFPVGATSYSPPQPPIVHPLKQRSKSHGFILISLKKNVCF